MGRSEREGGREGGGGGSSFGVIQLACLLLVKR